MPGYYEGDLVVGPAGTTAAIGTLVERTSGHLTAFLLPERHTAEATLAGLIDAVTRTGWPMRTLTWDRGTEMARHAQFTAATGIEVDFADPHAPWQRGSNENTNGLLREYFPEDATSPPPPKRAPSRGRPAQQPTPQTTRVPIPERGPRRDTRPGPTSGRRCNHTLNLGVTGGSGTTTFGEGGGAGDQAQRKVTPCASGSWPE